MIDLSSYNTLHVTATAENFVEINTPLDIKKLDTNNPIIFLGQGANILFVSKSIPQIAKVNLLGKKIVADTENSTDIEIASGENWHEFTTWAVNNQLSGVENMALIPGTVGAAAIGNIAAYNQNQEDIFVSLAGIDLGTGNTINLSKSDMKFGYRNSYLKSQPQIFVTSVTYRLSKSPVLALDYSARHHQSLISKLQQKFPDISNYSPKNVYDAIVEMRTEKLPDWKTLPNAGSFFKNPVISKKHYLTLKSQIPDVHAYPVDKLTHTTDDSWIDSAQNIKVPAGLLLDKLGWRGKRIGNVGTHTSQALCVVNYGATGQEIYEFTETMRADMKKNFEINLDYEVKLI